MESLDEVINESQDVREVKRALCVKMLQSGSSPTAIGELLNVSPQYVSKWKGIYEAGGAPALRMGYRGGVGSLSAEQRAEIAGWIRGHQTLSVEEVRDHVEAHYGVLYRSKQSYYDLMEAGGMSYHKSEAQNPRRDEAQIEERRAVIK